MSYVTDKQLASKLSQLTPEILEFPDFVPGDPVSWRVRANALYTLVSKHFPFQDGVSTCEFTIPYKNSILPARRYTTGNASGGVVLYIHGGGGVAGNIEFYDKIVRYYCWHSGVDFISLEYGLAPETCGLEQTEQVVSALIWLKEHSAELLIDPERIVLMGDSGGGGIVASATLVARDRSLSVAGTVMVYPMLDHQVENELSELTPLLSISREEIQTAWSARLGKAVDPALLPYISPSAVSDYSGLPPLFIDVGELDLFRRENIHWAANALLAGASVEFHLYPGVNHGFELLAPESDIALQAFKLRCAAIRRMIS